MKALCTTALPYVLVLALLSGTTATANPRLFVLAQGDCRDPDLVTNARSLSRLLRQRGELEVVQEDEFRRQVGAPAERGAAELRLQLESAQSDFYAGKLNRAKRLADDVLDGIRALPPNAAHWDLTAQALSTRFMILRAKGETREAVEAFRRILRVAPTHRLDEDYFSPPTRAVFEQVRRELTSMTKGRLEVHSQPAGASIFVDGALLGKTPATLQLVPGRYTLQLLKDDRQSFVRDVAVATGSVKLNVDLEFEGSLSPQRHPCLHNQSDEATRAGAGVKMGLILGVDEVVVLTMARPDTGSGVLLATVIDVAGAAIQRQGGIRVEPGKEHPDGLEDLTRFVATGNKGRTMIQDVPLASRPPVLLEQASGPAIREESGAGVRRTWDRRVLWALGGVSAAAAVTGTTFRILSTQTAAPFNQAYSDSGPSAEEIPELAARRDAARAHSLVSGIGFAVAGGALVAGLVIYWLGEPESDGAALKSGPGGVSMQFNLP